ncbi:response regulator [Agarilytica rhodophyticola]|uniref:response regulator n=1 Tax=Agarilytica rhodophyticola TaxID=1737490 RepID=UPI000B341775|nr:response regulator [Agarilytica rhodophyticola]
MFSKLKFQHQLSIIFSAGILILAFVSTLVISNVSSRAMYKRIVSEGLKLTETFAEQSTLALLYQSHDGAAEVSDVFLSFPDVLGVEVIQRDMTVLYNVGKYSKKQDSKLLLPGESSLLSEDSRGWEFVSPVYTGREQESQQDDEGLDDVFYEDQDLEIESDGISVDDDKQLIGYVKLYIGKESLNKITSDIFSYNLLISIILAFILLLTLLAITQRLTNPINNLSRTMRAAKEGEEEVRATLGGPRDIFEMIEAFNSMMDVLNDRAKQLKLARDEAFESARAKGEFAANVSHELRTPMNGVLGMLELLPDYGLTETQSEYVRIAKKSAQSLLTLIDDVLAFSKGESKHAVVEICEFNLVDLLDDIIALLGSKAQSKRIEFSYIIDADVPNRLFGDVEKIQQILINLVGNALKFTQAGYVYVGISVESNDNNTIIIFNVKDTGLGVSDEAKERIFEAFSQADNSTTRRFGGTGLGLSISRQLVSLMNGEIGIDSVLGSGSNFWFKLPLEPDDKHYVEEEYQNLTNAKLDILLVNEEPILSKSICNMLEPYATSIDVTTAITDTLRKTEKPQGENLKYDVIIIDEEFSEFNRLIEKLGQVLDLRSISVIVMAQRSVTSSFVKNVEINHYLSKPIRRKQLYDCMVDALYCDDPSYSHRAESNVHVLEVPKESYGDKKILVCEDNETNWLVATRMLETLGCNAKVVNNGKECLDELRKETYHLVLMDCHMPVMDGYEATMNIREQEQGKDEHIPIVAMTANNSSGEKEKCLAHGMDDYLPKPLSRLELGETVARWLEADAKEPSTLSLKNNTREYGNQYIPNRRIEEPKAEEEIELKVIDAKVFGELKQLLGDSINDVVRSFHDQLKSNLELLEQAIINDDSEQTRLFSHSIKGSASNFGAAKLVECSWELEAQSRDGNLANAIEKLDKIRAESDKVIDYLHAYL